MSVPSSLPTKPWTILAYIVADHRDKPGDDVAARIDQIAHEEVENLLWAADRAKVNIAVQIDYSHQPGVLRVIANDDGLERTMLPEDESAGRVETFTDFIRAAAPKCPAERYMLMMWGHGEGPIGFFADAHGGDTLPAADKTLSLPEFAQVLAFAAGPEGFGRKIDILLGKSCSLATIEAAYQLKDDVELMVCSQAIVPLRAWTYSEIFKALDADVERTGRALLDALDRQFHVPDARMGRAEVPFSLVRPSFMTRLAPVLKPLAVALGVQPGDLLKAPLLDAIAAARRPSCDAALLDVGALCDALARVPDSAVAGPAARLLEFLASADRPVLEHRPRDTAFHGISAFYLPPPDLRRFSFGGDVTTFDYRKLGVCEATAWDQVAFAVDAEAI
jgi:hypothetical protein